MAPIDRAELEKAIRGLRAYGKGYETDLVLTAAEAHLATLPKTKMVWLVTEISYGRETGHRHFETYAEARKTADRWRLTNSGEISMKQIEVPA